MRFFLKFAYNGQNYHGWQSQPNAVSVQQKIEEALSIVLRLPIAVTGAGRTDAGVHAREMYAHFDYPSEDTDNVMVAASENIISPSSECGNDSDSKSNLCSDSGEVTGSGQVKFSNRLKDLRLEKDRIILSLNRILGKDIAIYDIIPVADDAHARFDAVERSYKYFVTFDKTPFLYPFFWHSPTNLNLDKMNEAAALLLETDDFTSFAKLHSDAKTNICDVRTAIWQPIHNGNPSGNGSADSDNEYSGASNEAACLNLIQEGAVFTITADRFLRNMVRAVVGTLVEVGRGKMSIDGFAEVIRKKDRCTAGTSMPGNALFLWEVKYPYL